LEEGTIQGSGLRKSSTQRTQGTTEEYEELKQLCA
jgi:hypothetical protein